MTLTEGSLAARWIGAVRTEAEAQTTAVLERWLENDAQSLAALESDGVGALPADAGPAFARLGGSACDAGLELDAVRRIMAVLDDVLGLPGEPAAGRAPGADPVMPVLHGIVAGAWHVGCGGVRATDRANAGTGSDAGVQSGASAGAAADARPDGMDPVLAKLIRHDIKTPLQAASLNLELLAMEQEGNPAVTGAIETIIESLDSAVAMLQRFDKV